MTIPEAALEAAATGVFERTAHSRALARIVARGAIEDALPHLLPGLYVTHEQTKEGADSTIWAVNPDAPHLPTPMLARTQANAMLFDAVAALLPDRTDEAEDNDADPADVYPGVPQ